MPAVFSRVEVKDTATLYSLVKLELFGFSEVFKLYLWFFHVPFYKWILDTFNYAPWQGWGWNGTSILAPYSILWWIIYKGLTIHGYTMFGVYMVLVDCFFLYIVNSFKKPLWTGVFMGLSLFFYYFDPIDLLIVWIAVLGLKWIPFSLGAALTKLPVGAPLYVW